MLSVLSVIICVAFIRIIKSNRSWDGRDMAEMNDTKS
jgi:hypothetical protein